VRVRVPVGCSLHIENLPADQHLDDGHSTAENKSWKCVPEEVA
jgi:hypothetical protein